MQFCRWATVDLCHWNLKKKIAEKGLCWQKVNANTPTFPFSSLRPRLLSPSYLTWKLCWRSGVWVSLATSAPLCTSSNLCWWWAPRCTSTPTSTTPSSPTFRYGYTCILILSEFNYNTFSVSAHIWGQHLQLIYSGKRVRVVVWWFLFWW